MKLSQLSIFLENKPGHLLGACRLLAESGINVKTMALADTEQFGILRVLVRDTEKAKEVFEKNGTVVRVTEVLAVKLPDKPGELAHLLEILAETDINIEYMYGFNTANTNDAVVVLRLDAPDKGLKHLLENGVTVLGNNELFGV